MGSAYLLGKNTEQMFENGSNLKEKFDLIMTTSILGEANFTPK